MDGDVRMIVRFYAGDVIGEADDLDAFIELSTSVDVANAPRLPDDTWPDRTGEWRWVTYRPVDDGVVAVVAELEGENV